MSTITDTFSSQNNARLFDISYQDVINIPHIYDKFLKCVTEFAW